MKIEITIDYKNRKIPQGEKDLMWFNHMTDLVAIFDLDEFMFKSWNGKESFTGENKLFKLCASQVKEGYMTIRCHLISEERRELFTETIRKCIERYNFYYPDKAKIISGYSAVKVAN